MVAVPWRAQGGEGTWQQYALVDEASLVCSLTHVTPYRDTFSSGLQIITMLSVPEITHFNRWLQMLYFTGGPHALVLADSCARQCER